MKEKTRQETKQRERIDEKKLSNLSVSCCSFHETKPKKKQNEKDKKELKESKERKTRRKEERKEQERDRERGSEKGGGQKRLRRNKGRHSIISKNALFRGEQQFY